MLDATTVPKAEWDRPPWNRWSFQHVSEILRTAGISRGDGPVRTLRREERPLDDLAVAGVGGNSTTLAAFLSETFTDGFLVLHRGRIVHERYFNGMGPHTLHLSQSLAKSFTGALTGILWGRRLLDPAMPVADIVPELRATAYAGATVRHLLDMTSGVRFTEHYDDPNSDMGRADVAAGWKPIPLDADPALVWPSSTVDLILSLKTKEAEHGSRFSYRSIETDVLALALERTTGRHLAQLLSDELWQPLGMEQDADITVDRVGFATADGGLSACLRDYGRFGQVILDNGAGIVPTEWIEATRTGDHALFGPPYTAVLPDGAYRNQFWIADSQSRNLMARGVFGQLIHIDFEREVVVAKLSSWPHFVNPAWTLATLAAVRRIGDALGR